MNEETGMIIIGIYILGLTIWFVGGILTYKRNDKGGE